MSATASPRWIDITMEFGAPAGTWPGDAPLSVEWTGRIGDGKLGVNLTKLCSSPHNGTHSDAPLHVLRDGAASESLDVESYLGPCLVLDATKVRESQLPAQILDGLDTDRFRRFLFKTRTQAHGSAFPSGFKGLSEPLAQRLADLKARLAGIDSPSIDAHDARGLRAHKLLFGGGVTILENLEMPNVVPGAYELVALPLKVKGLCAAPVRALLRPASGPSGRA